MQSATSPHTCQDPNVGGAVGGVPPPGATDPTAVHQGLHSTNIDQHAGTTGQYTADAVHSQRTVQPTANSGQSLGNTAQPATGHSGADLSATGHTGAHTFQPGTNTGQPLGQTTADPAATGQTAAGQTTAGHTGAGQAAVGQSTADGVQPTAATGQTSTVAGATGQTSTLADQTPTATGEHVGTTAGGATSFLPKHIVNFINSPDATVTNGYKNAPDNATIASVAEGLAGLLETKTGKGTVKGHGPGSENVPSKIDKILDKLHIRRRSSEVRQETSDVEHTKYSIGDMVHFRHDQTDHKEADSWQTDRMVRLNPAQLEEVRNAGHWRGAKPSELFLNVYGQALLALDKDILKGMVSPALMGATGVVPLTIISVIPDIIHHHAVLITRAQTEIFLATNYWEASNNAKVITDAIKELSRRVVEQGRKPVVMKIMYDRGNPKQLLSQHQNVEPKVYTGEGVHLLAPNDIPGVQLEVQNYHVPPVGTFHSKYMVVDRKIALLCSNNIQDRVNLEMMVHIEGPIVQSFYDMALISWWNAMDPKLPLLQMQPNYPATGHASQYQFGSDHPIATAHGDLDQVAARASTTLAEHHKTTKLRQPDDTDTAATGTDKHGHAGKVDGASAKGDPNAPKSEAANDRTWDATNQAEADRVNGAVNSSSLSQHLNTGTAVSATDMSTEQTTPFRPIILLPPHDPVPMAMVNRPPKGRPGHGDTLVPQDQAWLAGFKFAQRDVFIQTPTFNAKPVIAATIDAVRRGIQVTIYADLGFNDQGELLPFQGGTNEMVAAHMYASLEPSQRDLLHVYWYTGKDQATPLNANKKSRNCHIKLMIVDGQIAIQGNGNQDSQSWYHSQEINILIDSPLICEEWRKAIESNQNTRLHGRVGEDGVWRDPHGNMLPGAKPPPTSFTRPFVALEGVKNAVQRARGEGGFAT